MTKKILVISHDKVGPLMAGPGMRYHQIAIELSKRFSVTLATFNPEHAKEISGAPYNLKSIKTYDFQADFDRFDTIIAMSLSQEMISYAKKKGIRLVFDLYAPVPVEDLIAKVFAGKSAPEEAYNFSVMLSHYQHIFRSGDFFLCSNPIQKDFWMGFAMASGATSPVSYTSFPLYEKIAELPMGTNLDELNEPHDTSLLSKRVPSIDDDDFVLLWTGGVWDWFDAITPIEAVAILVAKGYTKVKLVFFGTRHPNTDVPVMSETAKAYAKAKELEILDKHVFFFDGWVPYDERLSYLLRADVAVYAHKPSAEARYSHRTRILDHFLASLPSVVTRGDYLGDIIAEHKLGFTVDPLDPDAFSEAIEKIIRNPELRSQMVENIRREQADFTWEQACKPLVEYLAGEVTIRKITNLPSSESIPQKHPVVKIAKKLLPRQAKEIIKRHIIK